MSPDDPFRSGWLDAELRRAPSPEGLVGRLRRIPVGADEGLDALLRETPLPAGLMGRLRRIPFAGAPRERRWTRLERQAVAASLVSMVWFSYAAALVIFWLDYRPPESLATNWLRTESPLDPELPFDDAQTVTLLAAADLPSADFGRPWSAVVAQSFGSDAIEPAPPETPGELLAFGFSGDVVSLLKVSETGPKTPSIEVPAGPNFDRSFLSRTGVFPRVDPQHHPTSRVPLSTETGSFALAREFLLRDRFPPPEQIRTEEFLAAIDYGLARGEQPGVHLSAVGGRAAWELPEAPAAKAAAQDRTLWLLQFHVQAGKNSEKAPVAAAQTRLTVRFNPQAVASYRLCGHEPTRVEGELPTAGLDLPPGAAATAVYELQFRSDTEAEVAVATLEWTDPASGTPRSQRSSIRRSQFAPRIEQAPAALRLAGLATAAGEILRKSPYAASISPAAMLELARQGATAASPSQANPKQANPAEEFRKLVEIFERILAIEQRSDDARPLGPREARRETIKPAQGPIIRPATIVTVAPNHWHASARQGDSCFAGTESISWKLCPDSQAIVSANGTGTRLSLWRLRVISPAV